MNSNSQYIQEVSSALFLQLWKEECKKELAGLLEKWSCSKEYTDCIFPVIHRVAHRMNLLCYQEYYSLDAVFYSVEDRVPEIPDHNTWLRRIQVAVEHENNFNSGLFQEVSHLLITNCDLRILITYHNSDEERDSEFDRLHKIVGWNPESDRIATNRSFLIITGWEENGVITWEGRVFATDEWKRI